MYELILKKDGRIVSKDKGKALKFALPYLSRNIELEDGYTLRSYFKTVLKFKELQSLDNFFESFIEEYNSCKKRGCTCDDLEYIELYKEIGTSNESYGSELSEGYTVHGKATAKAMDEISGSYYAIEMSPLKELLDLPIKIASTIFFDVDYKKEPYEQIRKEYPDHKLTLFEFITSIIYELSFHGTPKKRNEAVLELEKRCHDIDSGTAKLIEMDEVFKRIEETLDIKGNNNE